MQFPARGEQLGYRNAKSVCKLGYVEERHVAERALDTADIRPMQIRLFGKALL
jgi:hypothetical protein